MKKACFTVVLCICLCFNFNVFAMSISAKSSILMDISTNEVLYENNAQQRLSMASTTKIMTAICAIENSDLKKEVTVKNQAIGIEGSSMYLKYNEKILMEDLLYGLMLSSGNDAAVAIALDVSGSIDAFCDLMNTTAQKIGAKNTHFKNPNGLDHKEHYTTAYDLALIASYAMKNEKFSNISSTLKKKIEKTNVSPERYLRNHNKMLVLYEGATGVKTGFTKKSGRCLVSSAKKDNLHVVAVTLNAPNDWNDHRQMLDFAFSNYKSVKLVEKGSYIQGVSIKNADTPFVKCVAKDDIFITLKKDDEISYNISAEINQNLNLPVLFGDEVGDLTVFAGNKQYKTKLIASNSANKKQTDFEKYIANLKNILFEWIYINY